MAEKSKDVLIRAVKTFVQAALALIIPALITYLNGGGTGDFSVQTVICPAIAAGISAVWNLALPGRKPEEPKEDNDDGRF